MKGERGDLRRPEGEGGRRRERASDGAALGRAARWGTERSRARGGSDLVRAGEIFLGERSGVGR